MQGHMRPKIFLRDLVEASLSNPFGQVAFLVPF